MPKHLPTYEFQTNAKFKYHMCNNLSFRGQSWGWKEDGRGQSNGWGQMFYTIILDWIHAVSPPKKKEKDILKNQVFAEIYHDVVASEKTVWFRKFDTGIIVEHKKDQNISMKVMGIDGATISHSTGPELTGIVKVASAFQNLYRNRQSNTIRLPLN